MVVPACDDEYRPLITAMTSHKGTSQHSVPAVARRPRTASEHASAPTSAMPTHAGFIDTIVKTRALVKNTTGTAAW